MNINYKKDPKIFSNTACISYSYFELLCDVLNYSIPIEPESIIGLSILAEAVVLHEELITNNTELVPSNDDEAKLILQFAKTGALKYDYNDERVNFPLENSAAKVMNDELKRYMYENDLEFDDVREHQIYISDINNQTSIEENLSIYQNGYYDEDHLQNAINYELAKEKIAELHGIPIINGIYYAEWGMQEYLLGNLNNNFDQSISKDLFSGIDFDRFKYIEKLKKYLGNTYVGLPAIISVILSRSKRVEDIPGQIILLRDEMTKFRKTCTDLEYNLRSENNFLRQCEIIDEIENAYNSLKVHGNTKNKRRIIKEGIEIFDLDLHSVISSIGKKTLSELDDKYFQLKIAGYYDLYRKFFDVEDNLTSLKRLFGVATINEKFLQKLNVLSKIGSIS